MDASVTPALILRARPFKESDILLDVYGQSWGRSVLLVRGGVKSRKRFFGLLLSGHYLEMAAGPLPKSDLLALRSAAMLQPHQGLRLDYRRWLHAGPVLELLLRATALHDPMPKVLSLTLTTLNRLSIAASHSEMSALLIVFLTSLLKELGFGLNLSHCLNCGKPLSGIKQAYLSMEGGLVCGDCPVDASRRPVPLGVVRGLGAIDALAASTRLGFTPSLLDPAYDFLSEFWRRVVGHDLPSLDLARALWKPEHKARRIQNKALYPA